MTTLLGVWAHPDDETYLSAGLMLRVARAGGRVACFTATSGEQGTDDPDAWPPRRLAAQRRRELVAALDRVGVHESRMLGLPDGGCDALGPERETAVVAALTGLMEDLRPDLVVTFGPDGITGHPDHVAVSRWTTDAWSDAGRPGSLLYATTTSAFQERHGELHRRVELFPPGYPRPCEDDEIALEVSLDPEELRRKRAALAAHASQTDMLAAVMGEDAFTHWWDIESFRLPRPAEIGLAVAS
jgi:LmbE family N-acetylglucosaminyl deacetylase